MNEYIIAFDKNIKKLAYSESKKNLLKYLKKILIQLSKDNRLPLKNNKIIITYEVILLLAKAEIFKKNPSEAHNLIQILKSDRVIHTKSLLFPKNLKLFSTNPLPSSFIDNFFPLADTILDIRDRFIEEIIMNIKSNDSDILLYIYLRLFHTTQLKPTNILKMVGIRYLSLGEHRVFIILSPRDEGYIKIEVVKIDKNLVEIFDKLYSYRFVDSLLDVTSQIFTQPLKVYEKYLKAFLSDHGLGIKQIRNAIDMEYQLENSPLELTLMKYKLSPKVTLSELDFIYPGIIDDNLLKIEKTNHEIYFNKYCIENQDDEEIYEDIEQVDTYISRPLEIYDELSKIRYIGKIKTEEQFFKYYKKWILFFRMYENDDPLIGTIMKYLELLLERVNQGFNRLSTLQGYYSILFNNCFNLLTIYGSINEEVILKIYENLESDSKLNVTTKKKYWSVIKVFFKSVTDYNTPLKINMALDIRRSIVFPEEFNRFIDKQIKKDKQYYSEEKIAKKIKVSLRSVFCMLLYYSGLRKTELRTRLSKDIIVIEKNEFIIYQNRDGFREVSKNDLEKYNLDMKSKNARRRVKFTIENKDHAKIILNYISYIKEKGYKFLFPDISENKTLLKKHVMNENYIHNLSKDLQSFTGRYTPLHSLRHSFATLYLLQGLEDKKLKHLLFELANIMGHADVEMTLNNYLHLELVRICRKKLQDTIK